MVATQHFWKRLSIVLAAIAGTLGILFLLSVAFGLFWSMFTSERVIVVNDTSATYELSKIWDDSDANVTRKSDAESLAPGKKYMWASDSFTVLRCIDVTGQGAILLNAPSIGTDERFANVIASSRTWRNIFGYEVTDYTINLSSMLANTQTLPCPWINDIVE